MRTRWHVSWSIKSILEVYKADSLDGLLAVEGKTLNDSEARQFLNECIEKGYKCLPICNSDDCHDFDYYGGGCPGHAVEEDDNQ